jgi:hypothetical protein
MSAIERQADSLGQHEIDANDPKRTFGFSFDHLVGEDEEWGRDSEAERFGGLGIEQQAHRVLRPVGHSLLMNGSNYFCLVGSPAFMYILSPLCRASRRSVRAVRRA